MFNESIEKLNLPIETSFKTFLASSGYQEEIVAQDVVWALDSLLKSHTLDVSANVAQDRFFDAYHCLDGVNQQRLNPGLNLAKSVIHASVKTIRAALCAKEVQQVGSVLFYQLDKCNPDKCKFSTIAKMEDWMGLVPISPMLISPDKCKSSISAKIIE